ncbi:unnamed protein product, partial [Sphacelaria rigidula]
QERLARNVRLADKSSLVRRDPLVIEDDQSFPVEHFAVPHHYKDSVSEILIPRGLVLDRIQKLAKDIREDYSGETIHLVCVLKGGSAYFHDLITALRRHHDYNDLLYPPFTYDFIRVRENKT